MKRLPTEGRRAGFAAAACVLGFCVTMILGGVSRAEERGPIELHGLIKGLALDQVTVEVQDPVYKKKKSYEGYRLVDLLGAAGLLDGLDRKESVFVFHSLDGYTPSMPVGLALKGYGVIAVRDTGAPKGSAWERLPGKAVGVTPEPYYLVWVGLGPEAEEYPWPFQLVSLEIVSSEEYYGAAYPTESESAREGFGVFRDHCMKCHSVNLVGGTLGPELNVPRNVLEYWKAGLLRGFIRDPSSYRARSKMPTFEHLGGREIDAVVRYLGHMGSRKICGKEKPCE